MATPPWIIPFSTGRRCTTSTSLGGKSSTSSIPHSCESGIVVSVCFGESWLTAVSRAVAEAWVAPDQKPLYASSEGLGQTFSFDILLCNFDAGEYRQCIKSSLEGSKKSNSTTTWVLSNHDVSPICPSLCQVDLADRYIIDLWLVGHATSHPIRSAKCSKCEPCNGYGGL